MTRSEPGRPGPAGPPAQVLLAFMAAADLDAVVAIERASFSQPWSRAAFTAELTNPYAVNLVARLGDHEPVCGYLCVWITGDEMHMNNLVVAPAYRRRGIGRHMLTTVLALARERAVRRVSLEVRRGNLPAIRLYEEVGFRLAGIRRRYYDDSGEDALVLVRLLSPPGG